METFIFDVDGTLTPSRGEMDSAFKSWFLKLCKEYPVYLVTGSDYPKTKEQVGEDVLIAVAGCYNCGGASLWKRGFNIRNNDFILPEEVKNWLTTMVILSDYKPRTGRHIEERVGLTNFSIVGRNATKRDRRKYRLWDRITNERANIAQSFNQTWPDYEAKVAGETGIDITPQGVSKAQILSDFDDISNIHFFGDCIYPNGNDYEIALAIKSKGGHTYDVNDWKDTYSLLREVVGGW